jgi:galactose mutarotase-like enzyme
MSIREKKNHTISNSILIATVKERGAELCSLKGKSGVEYMWRADPGVWGRHAPILFPVVGKLKNNSYRHEGETYELGQHGFARDMDFKLEEKSDGRLVFRLDPTLETLGRYPFEFVLRVEYRLEGNGLEIEYKVFNAGKTVMPFSIGAHPAFSLEWGVGDRIEDYSLEFEKRETADTRHLDEDKLLSDKIERVLDAENILPLRADMFDRDALILLGIKSKKVSLCSNRHANRVTVEFPGFPYLGIWAKPAAPYVCIEPWHGHVDPTGTDGDIMAKPGIIKLAPAAAFACVHKIVVEEQCG